MIGLDDEVEEQVLVIGIVDAYVLVNGIVVLVVVVLGKTGIVTEAVGMIIGVTGGNRLLLELTQVVVLVIGVAVLVVVVVLFVVVEVEGEAQGKVNPQIEDVAVVTGEVVDKKVDDDEGVDPLELLLEKVVDE